MRIGIDARMYGPKVSGIGIYVKNLINNLLEIDTDDEFVVFLLKNGYEEFQTNLTNVKKVLVETKWYTFKEQWNYWRVLEKEKTDIMHFPNFNVPLFFTRKFVVTIHDMTPWSFPGPKVAESSVRWFAYATVFNSAVKRAEKIITVSHFSEKEIIKKYNKSAEKIEVVHIGANLAFQDSRNYDIINSVKERYGIKKPYIFFIGVWRDHKNIPGLIKAFKILLETHNMDLQLVLAGEKTKESVNVENSIKESGLGGDKIISTGFVSDKDLPYLYACAEATVIPSFIEGFGMHGVESILCNTPVAASKTTSLPEILGDSALYFDPHDPENMAMVVKKLLTDNNLRNSLLEKGQKVVKKYNWRTCAERTLGIYRKCRGDQ